MARIDTLGNFLTDVADSIREKTGKSDSITPANFDTEIESISGGGDLSEYFNTNPTSVTSIMEIKASLIKKIPDVYIPSTVTNGNNAFNSSNWGSYLPIPKLIGGENITAYESLFQGQINITDIDCTGLNTSSCTSFYRMFYNCTQLTRLDLSSFTPPTTGSIILKQMFLSCTQLTFLDIRNMTLHNSTNFDFMFGSGSSNFNVNCEIIVKDTTEKDWVTTNFSYLTNVKTVAEYEGE